MKEESPCDCYAEPARGEASWPELSENLLERFHIFVISTEFAAGYFLGVERFTARV